MGFSGYMLIVADFIDYARGLGIPVGPGRGSVVGSLVSYALGITEVDPIEHQLLFERWLNPGRKSMPDIDVDFCFERRDEVLEYVRKKYGDDRVAQIITFGTIKGKQAIRDVGRVLGLSFAETDQIVKLYPAPKQGRDFPLERRARDGAAAQGRAQDCIPIFSTTPSSSKACCATPRAMRPASSFPISRSPTWCRSTSTRNATKRRCRSRSTR